MSYGCVRLSVATEVTCHSAHVSNIKLASLRKQHRKHFLVGFGLYSKSNEPCLMIQKLSDRQRDGQTVFHGASASGSVEGPGVYVTGSC
jgi:hypothetical protein